MKRSVFVCDRCKKDLQTPHIVTGRMRDSAGRGSDFEYHFCHDCMEAIGSLIATAPKTEAEEEKLLACPFCGSADIKIRPTPMSGYIVNCDNCWAASRAVVTKADAIAAWNRRAK